MESDGVFGLGEYLNENMLSYCTSSSKFKVSSNSDSASREAHDDVRGNGDRPLGSGVSWRSFQYSSRE